MCDIDKNQSKRNGTDVKDNAEPSELDPCVEDSKDNRKPDVFRRYRNEVCKKSGLSYKGLYIVGGIVIFAVVLFIIVIALAAAWPRIPHRFQFPICEDAECLRAASQIREGVDSSISPCEDIWNSTCGGWLKKYPLPQDKSIWNQKQQLVKRESERVRDLIATLKLPLRTGTVEWKLKHLYEACLDVDNVNIDEARPLSNIITELDAEQSAALLLSPRQVPDRNTHPIFKLTFIFIGAVYGKPGILNSPTPTPSAAPALLSNLATPTPSVASLQSVGNGASVGEQIVNIGGYSQGVKLTNPQVGLPTYGAGVNFGLGQQGLGLTQPGLSVPQSGLTINQPGISYGPPGLSLTQPGLPYIQPGFNFAQSDLNFGQPSLNFLPFGGGLNSGSFNLGSVGPTVSPFIGSTIGPSLESAIGANVGPTFAPAVSSTFGPSTVSNIGPTLAPAISSTFSPTLGSSIESVGPTIATPLDVGISGGGNIGTVSTVPVVNKHVYVYVAPEQPEEIIPRKPIVVPPQQTHYKIIFIKAPAPPKPTAPVIPPLPQDEEKTIVYVLARKPEEAPEIKIQTPPPTQPPKPEVYFIRYNAVKDGDDTVHGNRPEVDIDIRGSPTPVSVNTAGLGGIAHDLNTASLSGGSALSNAISTASDANLIQISTTPVPHYGPPSYNKK